MNFNYVSFHHTLSYIANIISYLCKKNGRLLFYTYQPDMFIWWKYLQPSEESFRNTIKYTYIYVYIFNQKKILQLCKRVRPSVYLCNVIDKHSSGRRNTDTVSEFLKQFENDPIRPKDTPTI